VTNLSEKKTATANEPRLSVRGILHPRAVAVFGASEDRGKFGGRITYFLGHHGFMGRIVPINLRGGQIRGQTAYPRLVDAPGPVDVAILALPPRHIPAALADCAAAGVGCCVIITTGFAEADEEGAALQEEILGIAHQVGMRIIGPNCMGLINPAARLALCSSVVLDTAKLVPGRIGLVSQSGGLMVSLFDRAYGEGIGFSGCVSLGNQCDLEICDFIEYFIADPGTDVICVHVEGLRDAGRFVRAAAACRAAGKRLVIVKTGKSPDGVRAAQSHTASLAGSYEAFAAICRANGVILADDPVAMVRIADILARCPRPKGDGIALLSGSGGSTGIAVDRLAGTGLRLARLTPQSRAGLSELLLPPQADNPVDFGGRRSYQPDDIAAPVVRILADDPDVHLFILYLSSSPFFEERTRSLAERALATGKPALAVVLPGPAGERPRDVLREIGCPYYDSMEDLLVVLRGIIDDQHMTLEMAAAAAERPANQPAAIVTAAAPPSPANLVAGCGISLPAARTAASVDQAVAAACDISYPIVLKGDVSGVVHKTDLGLVETGLRDAATVRQSWARIESAAHGHGLAAAFKGAIVQEQVGPGLELIVAIRRDPQFGPFVVVGAGGILVELMRDVASAPAPVSPDTARRLLLGLRLAPAFGGVRGGPPLDIEAAVDAVMRLSWLAVDLGAQLVDLEINPLIVGRVGAGARAVDVRATWQDKRENA
jgi:acetyl-CoA synthetase (ADP-forming)